MTEEIKEILEALKPHNNIKEYPLYLNRKQQDLLYDYITNLQREKSDICKNRLAIAIERDKLQQENEHLKNRLENKLTSEELVNMLNQELVRQNKCYKSRCEKAIEYIMTELITEWDIKNDGCVSGSDLPIDAITPILNILQGSDKNE